MNIRHFVTLWAAVAAVAAVSGAAAQEAPRRQLRPFATLAEAAADTCRTSRYIVPVGDFVRSESEGTVRFTAEFVYPTSWLNRQLLLRVGSASSGYTVEVDGAWAGHVSNGASPAEFNITKLSKTGVNTLTIIPDDAASNEPLTRAGVVWTGPCEIVAQPTVRIRDIDTRTTLNASGDGVFEVAIAVKSDALNSKQARISYELRDGDKRLAAGYKDMTLAMRGEDTLRFVAVVPQQSLWSADNPHLLTLELRNRIDGRYVENIVLRAGVREVKYEGNTLKINGEPVALTMRTVSGGYGADELRQLKAEGVNAVTVAAGEAMSGLCEAADEAGVYVVPQLAADTSTGSRSIRKGGNAVNDPALTEEYLRRTAAMFHTAKSHPSVAAFSLGGGEVNGINAQEAYLFIKGADREGRPVIFGGAAAEWNNDRFDVRTK